MKLSFRILVSVFVMAFVSFTMIACTGFLSTTTSAVITTSSTVITTSGEQKSVPVYQGMIVSDSLTNLTSLNDFGNTLIQLGYSGGWSRKAHDEPINQDDPFGDIDAGSIDEKISEEYIVTPNEAADYYSRISTDIYITVKLSNPDNFVILSFTLNGVFYQSYQFQEGSDSENLILKVNTGSTPGIKEYTIDAIKYVDGSDIKDAIFAGERTIVVGLAYSSTPSIVITNKIINATSMTMNINLSDDSSLSTLNQVVLYDGVELVQTYDLVVGDNSILFDSLNINTLYQYAVISIYDNLDGQNSHLEVFDKLALYTDDIVAINNVLPTKDSIGFGITVTDVDQVGAISAIELYNGETLIETLTDLNLREFTTLLSNNEYTIKVTYTYDLNNGIGEQTLIVQQAVTTETKATPSIVINNVVPTQDSIGFEITVTVVDHVGSVSAIELYKGEVLVEALTDLNIREFTGLLSNNEYIIKVTYVYDLNDGAGAQTLVEEQTVTTLAKATPSIIMDNVVPTQDSIGFGITVTDVDQVGEVTAIELYKGEVLVEALTDLNIREFTGQLSNNEYTIKVAYTYDLNDGVGEQTLVVSQAASTIAKGTPIVAIDNVVPTQSSIFFDITVTDVDQVGSITAIRLYENTDLIDELANLSERQFIGTYEEIEYRIVVIYEYNLNDGQINTTIETYHFIDLYADMVIVGNLDTLYSVPIGLSNSESVSVSGGFLMATTETTYKMWYEVRIWAELNGYYFQNLGAEGGSGPVGILPTIGSSQPVSEVSWRDTIVWLNALSEMNGFDPVYLDSNNIPVRDSRDANASVVDNVIISNNNGYRLPTAFEREMAAKWIDGTSWTPGEYISGANDLFTNIEEDMKYGWFYFNSGAMTHDVALLLPNQLGIYDMGGNVWEWTDSKFGLNRITYGGHFNNDGYYARTGFSLNYQPGNTGAIMGFRFVRNPSI